MNFKIKWSGMEWSGVKSIKFQDSSLHLNKRSKNNILKLLKDKNPFTCYPKSQKNSNQDTKKNFIIL